MTCGNLLCGCIGILFAVQGDLTSAAWLIVLAGVLDFGDGFVARAVGVSGPFGKELDSLADVVTFGVLPSFILFALIQDPFQPLTREISDTEKGPIWPYLAFSIAVCGALRLARFNIDTRQTEQFLGLPIPANALFVASLPMILTFHPQHQSIILSPYVLYGTIIILSLLMVSELPLMAFKFKSFSWAANQAKYSFLIASILLLLLLQFAAIPLIILLYILLSIVVNRKTKGM
ncbi:CDP-diacylglycerol--serine O-phosphatidyltransferase [Fibrella sp. HMF5335]|uniref:CDP-diacylglycerol--serine O-phosphatidyltransferase n=2 Tax=Fibrella rubiginis TaxID=2817060 RepID=A0A939GFW1_9BACT|nr:CDP-diacylglycerol--serine O-phosphatidyltransferase [Fibrella rubiginis]